MFGRHVYATGGNAESAKLSGVKVDRIQLWVYTISGVMAAIAGVVLTSRLNSAQPTAGTGYELDAIAAVVLGGTSLTGGRGWIFGTLVGALLIGVLNNGLNLMDVSSFYQQVIKGGGDSARGADRPGQQEVSVSQLLMRIRLCRARA